MYITFVYRPTLNLTTIERRIISEFFEDSAMDSVQGLKFTTTSLLEHLTDQMVMGKMNNLNLTYLIFGKVYYKILLCHLKISPTNI